MVDYRLPELAYGLSTQPGIGAAEQVRLPVQSYSLQSGYTGLATTGGVSAVSYGIGAEGTSSFIPDTSVYSGNAALSSDAIYPASVFFEVTAMRTLPEPEAAYTSIDGMKRSDGSIGTVKIPSLGITRKVWEGETTASMSKGMGHYSSTSAWDGNVGVCGHNRGSTYAIGSIRNLKKGDTITYTTVYGTRTYAVTSVETISSTDWSRLQATPDNRITMTTCLANQPEKRVCVQAVEVV